MTKDYFQRIWVIALNAFRETVRDKLLYSLVAFAALAIAASLLAGSVSLGQDIRVITDFGLTAILIFLLIITLFISTQLVWREVEHKTIYLALTKPISRDQFYLGKFFGLCLTIAVSAAVMGVIFLTLLYTKTHALSVPAIWAIGFLTLEAWLLTALGLLFSAFASPISSAVYTFCLVLIGHASSSLWLVAQKSPTALKGVLEFVYYLFPNLEKFNLRNEVVYNFRPDLIQVLSVFGYFVAFTGILLIAGAAIFRQDEF